MPTLWNRTTTTAEAWMAAEEAAFRAFCLDCNQRALDRAERINVTAIGPFRVVHLTYSPAMLRWFFDEGYGPAEAVAEITANH
jgi:hypothetical protein